MKKLICKTAVADLVEREVIREREFDTHEEKHINC